MANAECLSGLVMHQLASPGAPFVYGANVNVIQIMAATNQTRCYSETGAAIECSGTDENTRKSVEWMRKVVKGLKRK